MPWKQYQTARPSDAEIQRWLAMRPSAWAVVAGAISRVVVLDWDGVSGAALMRMQRIRPHLRTPSGGYHTWVIHPRWRVPTLNWKADPKLGAIFRGLDIRADGGYAAFTGRTPKGEYLWLREMAPDPLDSIQERMRAVLGLLHSPEPPKQARKPIAVGANRIVGADVLILRALDLADNSGRNNAALWLATQARDNGYSHSDDWVVRNFAAQVGASKLKGHREPFSEREALACWRNAFTRAARQPWGVR